METVIIVSGSEYETSLQCLPQFLELRSKRQAGLSCESIHQWRTVFDYVLLEWRMSLV